jgi:uncharacterized membrane-anchored protein YhcB (DUF1043 family)
VELLQKDVDNLKEDILNHLKESEKMVERLRRDIDELYNIDRSAKVDCGACRQALLKEIAEHARLIEALQTGSRVLAWVVGIAVATAGVLVAALTL